MNAASYLTSIVEVALGIAGFAGIVPPFVNQI